MVKLMLTSSQREQLIRQHRLERDGRTRDHIKAVLLRDDGYSYLEISRILLKDESSIRRQINTYVQHHQLKPQHIGSQPKLDEHQERQLIAHLTEVTYLYVKDIACYIDQQFGIHYTVSGLRDWLIAHGFRYKKPQPTPAKANPAQQEVFIAQYNELKKQVLVNHEPLYFVDSMHPQHQTQRVCGWIPMGVKKYLATSAKPTRLTITGAIDLTTHEVIYQQSERVNAQSMHDFFSHLRDHHPSTVPIHVILDNAGYNHSHDLQDYAHTIGVELHYLPPYSPNLNPIERLWKLLREAVTYNHYYDSFAQFTEAIAAFLTALPTMKEQLHQRINDHFELVQPPNFQAVK